VIEKASFPVIDAHNHLWGNRQVERIIKTMDEVGVTGYCDLTGNVKIEFSEGGYSISSGNISDFFDICSLKYPGRFYCFTMANFILPHFGNYAENIQYVSDLLSENPNVYIDFSARIDELGRQPYSSREFFIRHQDRIVFGTDMPANTDDSVEMYRTYFRFLETFDESFYSPDYDGTFERARWPVCGIGLPKEVLRKIYYENILKIIPSLKSVINFK
jgi:DNA-directed RNA polymerase subunit N (RpoN/RPB10)